MLDILAQVLIQSAGHTSEVINSLKSSKKSTFVISYPSEDFKRDISRLSLLKKEYYATGDVTCIRQICGIVYAIHINVICIHDRIFCNKFKIDKQFGSLGKTYLQNAEDALLKYQHNLMPIAETKEALKLIALIRNSDGA